MPVTRRQFLTALAGTLSVLPFADRAFAADAAPDHGVRFFSARADLAGRYYFTAFDADGRVRFDIELPGRGHGMAVSPDQREVVALARRPGRFMRVIDLATGTVAHRVASRADRHFYGHAEFSPDGRWLFTPENDFGRGVGVIGVRDARDGYRQVGEFDSHGVGPHDLRFLSDGRTLVVATGGIRTHPDIGRAKLNLESMAPALTYLDGDSGELLENHPMPARWHRNGIRHLAIDGDDRVCFVTQYEGAKTDRPPLVGMHRRGGALELYEAPAAVRDRMRNYCGSVCVDAGGRWFAVSSPRGNLVTFWEAADGRYVGAVEVSDGCGVAGGERPGEFMLSSGTGEMLRYDLGRDRLEPAPAMTFKARWDNHMLVARPA